eukprot:CAMPEP_0114227570 /NCGR_PEP_ID=MMETSP0058-20121206/1862_1 /TAXON_ID=36894 /ORGANISM="Pyramimonas parkeae, CCMP726" /LENGTH=51 /DNA_ID=CAMNT_0001338423 /DNA_START=890 /DNA_END=1045 /DNA_ORIENTATION=-
MATSSLDHIHKIQAWVNTRAHHSLKDTNGVCGLKHLTEVRRPRDIDPYMTF